MTTAETTARECRQAVLRAISKTFPGRVSMSRLLLNPEIGARMFTENEVREAVTTLIALGYIKDTYNDYPAAGHAFEASPEGVKQIQGLTIRDPLIWGLGAD